MATSPFIFNRNFTFNGSMFVVREHKRNGRIRTPRATRFWSNKLQFMSTKPLISGKAVKFQVHADLVNVNRKDNHAVST